MSDTRTVYRPEGLPTYHCSWCRRIIRVAPRACESAHSALARAGWIVDPPYAPICDICHAEQPWHLPVEDSELAEAMSAEDARPKQTEAEAAQAYDAETVERAIRLLIDLSAAGRITEHAFAEGACILATLKCAVNNPGIQSWGATTNGERGQATNEEAL